MTPLATATMNGPPNLELATPIRRISAGFLNFLVVGFLIEIARMAEGASFLEPAAKSPSGLLVVGLLSAFWLSCLLKKTTFGAFFCLLEVRQINFLQPTFAAHLFRTLPYYLAALVAYFPAGMLPLALNLVRLMLLYLILLAFLVNGGFLIFSRRSLIDRWLKLVVLRVNLPDRLRPRIFGIRIS